MGARHAGSVHVCTPSVKNYTVDPLSFVGRVCRPPNGMGFIPSGVVLTVTLGGLFQRWKNTDMLGGAEREQVLGYRALLLHGIS